MTPETAIKMALAEYPEGPLWKVMETANQIYNINSMHHVNPPFAGVDVVFSKFVDYVNQSGTQRERDLIVISEKLQPVWKTLHLTVGAMKEEPSPFATEELKALVSILMRYDLQYLLFDGISSSSKKWLKKNGIDVE